MEDIASTQKNCRNETPLRTFQNENCGIKHCFALVKNLCKNAAKYFALFCAYREH